MDEHRQYPRRALEATVFIEVMATEGSSEVVRCRSADMSAGGLQVEVDREILLGSILQIGAALPGSGDPLFLAAETRWCRPNGNGAYLVGFALLNASDSHIDSWVALSEQMQR
jgi:hypothetical protein